MSPYLRNIEDTGKGKYSPGCFTDDQNLTVQEPAQKVGS